MFNIAQVSFDVAATMQSENTQYNNNVEFFTLVNDGDEAIVRFLYDSTEAFNIMTVHTVNVGGKWRKVNCLREPQDPTDVCPLCASGSNITNRFFIHMLVYKKDQQGQIVPVPAVWERGFNYATKLKSLLDEYGPLSNELFKVKRNGAKGSMDTTYDIMYCSPKVYDSTQYPLIDNPFGNWKELGTIVLEKDATAMNTFLMTGSFPEAPTQSNANTAPVQPQYIPKAEVPQNTSMPQQPVISAPVYAQPAYTAPVSAQPAQVAPPSSAPVTEAPVQNLPWMNPSVTSATPNKPTRYY